MLAIVMCLLLGRNMIKHPITNMTHVCNASVKDALHLSLLIPLFVLYNLLEIFRVAYNSPYLTVVAGILAVSVIISFLSFIHKNKELIYKGASLFPSILSKCFAFFYIGSVVLTLLLVTAARFDTPFFLLVQLLFLSTLWFFNKKFRVGLAIQRISFIFTVVYTSLILLITKDVLVGSVFFMYIIPWVYIQLKIDFPTTNVYTHACSSQKRGKQYKKTNPRLIRVGRIYSRATALLLLSLLICYGILAVAAFEGNIRNSRIVWGADNHFYGQYLSSGGYVENTTRGCCLGSLDYAQLSWAAWKIDVFQYPHMREELKNETRAYLLIKQNTPKADRGIKVLDGGEGQILKVPSSAQNFAIYPPMPGYCTFIGKYFLNGAKGFIKNVLVYARNTDSIERPIHMRFSRSPGENMSFERTLLIPPETEGWLDFAIDHEWSYDSVFVYVYMDPLENATPPDPVTYPVKIGWDTGGGKADAYITIASVDAWQREDSRYLIKLVVGRRAEDPDPNMQIIFNGHEIVNAKLLYGEGNLSILSPYQFDINFTHLSMKQVLRIPIDFDLVKKDNLLNITIDEDTYWDIYYINLWLASRITDVNPFWRSLISYPLIFLAFGFEVIVVVGLAAKLVVWLSKAGNKYKNERST
jgi:hypothetical protein